MAHKATWLVACSMAWTLGCGSTPEPEGSTSQSIAFVEPAPTLPGTVYAEQYDQGGEGVAYHDREATNFGGAFRTSDGVDIADSANAGLHVGWLDVDDWMKYTIDATVAGTYRIRLRYASANPPSPPRAEVRFDGGAPTTLTLGNTGGWDAWQSAEATVTLGAGRQVMTIRSVVDYWNLDTITFELLSAASSTPYSGTPNLPGTVSAELFDRGGEGVAYHDHEPENFGGAFRTDEGVDIADSAGAGRHIGWLDVGDWTKYTVNVATTGSYTMKLRYASMSSGTLSRARVTFSQGGSKELDLANTGGWDSWQIATTSIDLTAGAQVMTVESVVDRWNLDSIELTPVLAPPPPPPGSGGTLRVVTWNIQGWTGGCASCQAAKIVGQNPDVVLLQEADDVTTVELIRSSLSAAQGVSWTRAETLMMTNKPLLEPAELRDLGPNSWGGSRWGARMKIDVGGIAVNVFGTHLDWYYDYYVNHATNRDNFLAFIDQHTGPKVAGGDLNAWTWGSAEQIQTIGGMDQRLTDACSSVYGSHQICNDMRTNFDGVDSWRPDYIYRSSSITTKSYAVVDREGLSDHQLVVAELQVAP